jgi:hypothetical protein
MTQIIDGFGQIGTRVWENIADAPAPRLGAIICVDEGVNGLLWFGGHDSGGTLVWKRLLISYLDALIQVPLDNTRNTVHPATGVIPITTEGVSEVGAALTSDDHAALFVLQTGTPTQPVIDGGRDHLTEDVPLLNLADSDAAGTTLLNGRAQTGTRIYPSLPVADEISIGCIICVDNGADGDFFKGVHDHAGTPVWSDLRGPQGPDGTVTLPGLPAAGLCTDAVYLVPASGFILPNLIPPGYTVTVVGFSGLWEISNGLAIYVVDGNGSSDLAADGFGYGALVYVTGQLNAAGIITANSDPTLFSTTFSAIASSFVKYFLNVNSTDDLIDGYLLVEINICAPPVVACAPSSAGGALDCNIVPQVDGSFTIYETQPADGFGFYDVGMGFGCFIKLTVNSEPPTGTNRLTLCHFEGDVIPASWADAGGGNAYKLAAPFDAQYSVVGVRIDYLEYHEKTDPGYSFNISIDSA